MRITCPSCSSSFEIPAELLGRKGRALKCARCGHSWYQAAQVDSLDLASIMGEDYAAKAKVGATPKIRSEVKPIQPSQQKPPGSQNQPANAPPLPPGAVSMMNRNAPRPGQPGAQGGPQHQQPGQQQPPMAGQTMRGDAAAPPGQGAVSWMGKQQGGPGMPGQSMAGPGGPSGPGGPGQSMRGPDQTVGPGEAAVSWMGKEQGGPGAEGQSMRGEDNMAGPGEEAVSWMGKEQGSGGPGQGPDFGDASLAEGEDGGPSDDFDLMGDETEGKVPDEFGVSGGPGAASEEGETEGGDDLVDPDADRPDFGSSDEPEEENAEEAEDVGEDEDAFASVAARAGDNRAARKKKSKPIDPAYITAGIMGVTVLTLGLLIWFGRGMLTDMWPSVSGFYDSMGVEAEQPGDGLSIAESNKRLMRIGGIETLVLSGFVSNIGDVAKPVPGLRLELYDQRNEVIQDASTSTRTSLLDPGATVQFEFRLELPRLDEAQGYRIVWETD